MATPGRHSSRNSGGITARLADCIGSVDFRELPEEVRAVAKVVVLDGLANILAGSTQPLGEILIRHISALGGVPTATIIGTAAKTNAPYAAYANAAFCHSMDYEAMWWPPTHPTSPVLPALLALAEQEGLPGTRVMEALVVGFEVQGRLNLAVDWITEPYTYFHPPGTLGAIGSASACSKLLGLDPWETRMAIGIAASRTGGLWANTGSMTKSQHSANSARAGVECTLLAREGYTSNENIIENKTGGFGQLILGEEADLELIVKDFGKPYRMSDPGITIKRYPAQTTTHWSIDAALELRDRYKLKAADIREVVVRVGFPNWSAHWPKPRSGLEGKFSIHYTVALALLDGKLTIDSFDDRRRFSPAVDSMLEKIAVIEDTTIPPGLDFAGTWATVTVTLEDGTVVSARCERPRGRWDNPLTREERMLKFYDCALRVLEQSEAQQVVDLVEKFEALQEITGLMSLLQRKGSGRAG
ncbi:MAG: MmgE/PrpD family protein [Deltaproteobacteria bacterium]|nr:MmgE/PrpD family protein [Deltaproteobacteria bacterium]